MLNESDQNAIERCAELVAELAKTPGRSYDQNWKSLEEALHGISDNTSRAGMAKYIISLLAFRSESHFRNTVDVIKGYHVLGLGFNDPDDTALINQQLEQIKRGLSDKQKGKPMVISVLSQKGGVGKSTIALAVAAHLAKKHKVTLVELDFGGPTLYNYIPKATKPYLNKCFVDHYLAPEKQSVFKDCVWDSTIDRLTICPANPDWEGQIYMVTESLPHPWGALRDYSTLQDLIKFLHKTYGTDYIVFDTATETIKDLSRTVADLTSCLNGIVLLVTSLQILSWCPLLEDYWRTIDGSTRSALIFNRVPQSDLPILSTSDSLIQYTFAQNPMDIRTFGIPHRSAALLRNMLPPSIPLIGIRESENLMRESRSGSLQQLLQALPEDYERLYAFIDSKK